MKKKINAFLKNGFVWCYACFLTVIGIRNDLQALIAHSSQWKSNIAKFSVSNGPVRILIDDNGVMGREQ